MTTPKLALIPSAYKASKVYSPLPINGDGDFTFTRNTEATRVNKETIVKTIFFIMIFFLKILLL